MGLVEVLREENERRRVKGIVRLTRTFAARGLSCIIGAELVIALGDPSERSWALAMLAQIRKRVEARGE